MATFYGVSSSNVSSLFSSGYRSSKSSSGNGLYDSLGDYGVIKRGGYFKLCKAFYAQEENQVVKPAEQEKANKVVAEDVLDLKQDVKSLSGLDYTEENREKVTAGIKDFVKSYNSLISSSEDSNNSKIESTTKHLTNYTKVNASLLKKVGISVGSDNKLIVDSSTLEKADMSDIKSLFKGSTSFAGRASQYASTIYTTAVSNNSSLYSSSGSYSSLNMSSLYDSYL